MPLFPQRTGPYSSFFNRNGTTSTPPPRLSAIPTLSPLADSSSDSSPESTAPSPSVRSPLTSYSSGSSISVPRSRPIATVNISTRRNALSPASPRRQVRAVVNAGSQTGGLARRRNSQEGVGHTHHNHHCSQEKLQKWGCKSLAQLERMQEAARSAQSHGMLALGFAAGILFALTIHNLISK